MRKIARSFGERKSRRWRTLAKHYVAYEMLCLQTELRSRRRILDTEGTPCGKVSFNAPEWISSRRHTFQCNAYRLRHFCHANIEPSTPGFQESVFECCTLARDITRAS